MVIKKNKKGRQKEGILLKLGFFDLLELFGKFFQKSLEKVRNGREKKASELVRDHHL